MEMKVQVYLLQGCLHLLSMFSLQEQFFLPKLQEIYTVRLLQEMSFSHFLVEEERLINPMWFLPVHASLPYLIFQNMICSREQVWLLHIPLVFCPFFLVPLLKNIPILKCLPSCYIKL